MGVAVIIQYARLYPDHAQALVFVDGSVTMPPNARDSMLSFARKYAGSSKAREAMVQAMFSLTTSQEVRKLVLSMTLAAPAATAVGMMEAYVDPAIWKEDVFRLPVLGVYASLTTADRESDREYMKTRFPKLKLVNVPATGHFLMLERATEFNRLLESFLDNLK